jgi:hypothetical protein
MTETPGAHLTEEPQEQRGAPGSRDTGSDEPAGGPVDRPVGTAGSDDDSGVDPQGRSPRARPTCHGRPGRLKPAEEDAMSEADSKGRPMPPYDGRRESADIDGPEKLHKDGANVGAATGPVESDAELKAPDPAETPRGAVGHSGRRATRRGVAG